MNSHSAWSFPDFAEKGSERTLTRQTIGKPKDGFSFDWRCAMGMTEVWNYRDEALARIDLRGFEVRARDGAIGKVVQAMEAGRGCRAIEPGVAMPRRRQLHVPVG